MMSNKRQKRSTEIIKFNIGGDRFEVSRDMLETNHPDTMLARIASEQWQQDPDAEIFIERDGKIFRHVLSFLRDDNVNLPITVSKEMLINELSYYGIDFEEAKIHEKASNIAMCIKSVKNGIEELEKKSRLLLAQSLSSKLAAKIIKKFYLSMTEGTLACTFIGDDRENAENVETLIRILGSKKEVTKEINSHLENYGIELTDIRVELNVHGYATSKQARFECKSVTP